jgi:hypothetical protein
LKPAKWLAPVPLSDDHPDLPVIREIEAVLLRKAGGLDIITLDIPRLIRKAIDKILDTPVTGRLAIKELSKNEKTHIGTMIVPHCVV